jgi:hypothetical protein
MGEVREFIRETAGKNLRPFGMIEVGGGLFLELLDELVDETKQMHTGTAKDLSLVHVKLPDGQMVYLNPALHPAEILISNVEGNA